MRPPEEPLRSLLKEGADEEELQRVWRRVQRHRARAPARWTPTLLVVVLLSTLVFAGVQAWWPVARTEGALRDQLGRVPVLMESRTPLSTSLSDGSRVELWANSALEVLENDGDTFACALRRGRASFDVVPGGPRRWKVEVGAVTIEVVGTRFHVDRRDSTVVVEVERGAVLVRGENVRDGVQKLQPGTRLEIATARPLTVSDLQPLSSASVTTSEPASTAPQADSVNQRAASAPAPVREQDALGGGLAEGKDLLALADQQRRRGDLRGAISTLRLAIERASDDTHAATAAFTLGKLLLDTGQPGEAQAAFRTCLNRSPPSAIAEDALARLVEAQSRSGAREAALASAREYERRYPNGRRLAHVRRWTSAH
jgi:transmembrane sensor